MRDSTAQLLKLDAELQRALDEKADIKEYASEQLRSLEDAEYDALDCYIAESDTITLLHDGMTECDAILAKLEDMIRSLQYELGTV